MKRRTKVRRRFSRTPRQRRSRRVLAIESLEAREMLAADFTFTDLGTDIADGMLATIQDNLAGADAADFAIPLLAKRLPEEIVLFSQDLREDLKSELAPLDNAKEIAEADLIDALYNVLHVEHGVLADLNEDGAVNKADIEVGAFDPEGGDVQVTFQLADEALEFVVPEPGDDVQLGFQFLPIEVEVDPSIALEVDYTFQPLTVIFNQAAGEFEYEFAGDDPALTLGIDATLESSEFSVSLGLFQGVSVTDNGSQVGVSLSVDIDADGAVDIESPEPDIDIDLTFEASASEYLPSMMFDLHWNTDGPSWSGSDVVISQFQVGLGSVMDTLLGPVIKKLGDVFQPIFDVVHYATQPLPVIEALTGQQVTLLDVLEFATQAADIPAQYELIVDAVLDAANFVSAFSNFQADDDGVKLLLGDFQLESDNLQEAETHDLSELLDGDVNSMTSVGVSGLGGIDAEAIANTITGYLDGTGLESFGQELAATIVSAENGAGFEFPVFKDPRNLVNLVLGRPEEVDIFQFGAFFQEIAQWEDPFSVPMATGLSADLEFNLDPLVNLQLGYDARGIVNAIKDGNAGALADGLYLAQEVGDISGTDYDIGASLGASVEATLSAGVPLLEAELSGEIHADLAITVPDPVNPDEDDSKVRLTDELGPTLFQVSGGLGGSVSFGFHVGVKLFGKWLGYEKEWTLAEAEFGSFNVDAIPNPFDTISVDDPNLAELAGGVLELSVGPNRVANNRNVDPDETDESISVFMNTTEKGVEQVVVSFAGVEQAFNLYDKNGVQQIDEIFADAGIGADTINIDESVWLDVDLSGGNGADTLIYEGSGAATLDGGDGDDVLWSNGDDNTLLGGDGEDELTGSTRAGALGNYLDGGDQNDVLFGGSGLNILIGGAGSDHLHGGSGQSTLYGDGGDDALTAGAGDTDMFGGAGSDVYVAGAGENFVQDAGGTAWDYDRINWAAGNGNLLVNVGPSQSSLALLGDDTDEVYDLRDAPGNPGYLEVMTPGGVWVRSLGVRNISIDAVEGQDTINVHYLHDIHLENVSINGSDNLAPDGEQDQIFVEASTEDDQLNVSAHDGVIHMEPNGNSHPTLTMGAMMLIDGLGYLVSGMVNPEDDLQLDTFEGNDTVNVYGATGTFQLNTHEGNDSATFYVDEIGNTDFPQPVPGYYADLNFDAGSGVNYVTATSERSENDRLYQLTDTQISSGNFAVDYSGDAFGLVRMIGSKSHDEFNVLSTRAEALNLIQGRERDDTLYVGDKGSLDAIHGTVHFQGQGGNNHLQVNDRAATSGNQNVEIDHAAIKGIAGKDDGTMIAGFNTTFEVLGSDDASLDEVFHVLDPDAPFAIRAGGGDDEIFVEKMAHTGAVYGETGDDSIHLTDDLSQITATLAVYGEEGNDWVEVNDQLSAVGQVYTLTQSHLWRGAMDVQFDDTLELLDVTTTDAGDLVQIQDEPVVGDALLHLAKGTDEVHGPNADSQWTVNLNGEGQFEQNVHFDAEVIVGGDGDDQFFVEGSTWGKSPSVEIIGGDNPVADSITTAAGMNSNVNLAKQLVNGSISFDGIEWFQGEGASDHLIGDDFANVWHITGGDEGSVFTSLGAIGFGGFENLQGRSQSDYFVVHAGGEISGNVHAGAGEDWLNYSLYDHGVIVDLSQGTATAFGSIASFENVEGSDYDDILIGGNGANTLFGGDGADVLVGGGGDDTLYGGQGRDLLIGGTGADWLFGGDEEDILIGGSTTHDKNVADLQAVMAEWTRTDHNRKQRVYYLTHGGKYNGDVVLSNSTVIDDGAVDHLFGEGDLDFFWPGAGDLTDAAGAEL